MDSTRIQANRSGSLSSLASGSATINAVRISGSLDERSESAESMPLLRYRRVKEEPSCFSYILKSLGWYSSVTAVVPNTSEEAFANLYEKMYDLLKANNASSLDRAIRMVHENLLVSRNTRTADPAFVWSLQMQLSNLLADKIIKYIQDKNPDKLHFNLCLLPCEAFNHSFYHALLNPANVSSCTRLMQMTQRLCWNSEFKGWTLGGSWEGAFFPRNQVQERIRTSCAISHCKVSQERLSQLPVKMFASRCDDIDLEAGVRKLNGSQQHALLMASALLAKNQMRADMANYQCFKTPLYRCFSYNATKRTFDDEIKGKLAEWSKLADELIISFSRVSRAFNETEKEQIQMCYEYCFLCFAHTIENGDICEQKRKIVLCMRLLDFASTYYAYLKPFSKDLEVAPLFRSLGVLSPQMASALPFEKIGLLRKNGNSVLIEVAALTVGKDMEIYTKRYRCFTQPLHKYFDNKILDVPRGAS